MSTAIGIHVNGRTYIAAGSGSTLEQGAGTRRIRGTQYLLPDVAGSGVHVAVLGSGALLRIVPRLVEATGDLGKMAHAHSVEFPLALGMALGDVARERGWDDVDLEGLVAIPRLGLWDIAADDAEEIPEGEVAAVGSGAFAALGAWHAQEQYGGGDSAVVMLERAVLCAIGVDLHTTGPVVSTEC